LAGICIQAARKKRNFHVYYKYVSFGKNPLHLRSFFSTKLSFYIFFEAEKTLVSRLLKGF